MIAAGGARVEDRRFNLAAAASIAAYLAVAALFSARMPMFADEADILRPALDRSFLGDAGSRTIKYPLLPYLTYSICLRAAMGLASRLGFPESRFPLLGAARALNLVFSGLALFVFFRTARRLFDREISRAFLATALLATTPAFFFATQVVKAESLLLVFVCLSLLAALKILDAGHGHGSGSSSRIAWRTDAAMGVLAGLAVIAKLNLAIIALYVPVVAGLWKRRSRGEIAAGAAAYAAGCLAVLGPSLPHLWGLWRQAAASWLADEYFVPGPSFFRTASGSFLRGRPLGVLLLWLPFAAGLGAYGLALAGLAGRSRRLRHPSLWVSYPVVYLLVTLAATPSTFAHLYTPMMPFLAIVAASALPRPAMRRRTRWWVEVVPLAAILAAQCAAMTSYSTCLRNFHGNLAQLLRLARSRVSPETGSGETGLAIIVSAHDLRPVGGPSEVAARMAEGRVRRAILLDSYVENLCAHGGGEYASACRILGSAMTRGLGYTTLRKIETRYPMRGFFAFLDPEFSFTLYLLVQPDDPLASEAPG